MSISRLISLFFASLVLVGCASAPPKSDVALNVGGQIGNADALKGKKLPISGIQVNLGVHLERLTLLSGEGHTGSKITSGLMAGAATMIGAGGGIDFASREPVGEHFTEADAKKVNAEIVKILNAAMQKNGVDVADSKAVIALPAYAKLKGESKLKTDTQMVKGKMFNPDYYFGLYQMPTAGYKYLSGGILSDGPKDAATATMTGMNVPASIDWEVDIVNDRKVMRVRNLTLRVWASNPSLFGNMTAPQLTISVNPDEISVPSGESHKNLEYWNALSPSFEKAANAIAQRLAFALTGK
jgi:hypothetical protein